MINKQTLNGKWHLICNAKNIDIVGDVPASNFTMLLKAGVIEDPFVSTNESKMAWIGENDWQYSREFTLSKEVLESKYITLECKQLDTICSVYINDKLVGEGKNSHIGYSFNIKDYVVEGNNKIDVKIVSPVNYVKQKQAVERVPRNNNGQNGIPHIRKPQCHFGWDWGPVLVGSGIMKNIFIKYSNYEDIKDFDVKQIHKDNVVTLQVKASASDNQNKWQVKVISPNNEILYDEIVSSTILDKEYVIKNPQLWWTYELSPKDKQPLYFVEVSLINDDAIITTKSKKIGIRTLVLNRNKDEYGANFCFELNGVSIFSKGANLIPFDSLHDRVDSKVIDYYIDACRYSNFNMIRVWGGGYYADDYFYDKCDEYGILVWQDFMFACQPYPFFDDELLNNVLDEVDYNVKRIKHHASLAVLCGNNEIELMEIAWKNRRNYCKYTEKFFYHILPDYLDKIDKDLVYIEGTPCGIGYDKGHSHDNVGDTHLWAVWHGLQPLDYYRTRMTRFCSEFGFESLPDLKAIEKFASKEDYSLSSKVFNSHQKCLSGNKKMKYYIASRFYLPSQFEDYIYLSQICQLECIKDASLHWRRNKGRCNGSLYWQFNDCWPVCSWASIDYYGNYKALQYGARKFFAPVALSVIGDKQKVEVYINNDTLVDKNLRVESTLIDFEGKKLFTDEQLVNVKSNTAIKHKEYPINSLGNFNKLESVFVVKLFENDNLVSSETYLFDKEKNLLLPKANINMDICLDKDDVIIELSSDKYCRYVSVYSTNNSSPLQDNYFDLLPNEKVIIKQKNINNHTTQQLSKEYKVMSLCDVNKKGSKLSDNFERFKIFIEPENFFQYLYYCFLPKNLKIK